MTTSRDLSEYVDLTVYDKDPEDLVAAAVTNLATNLPDWVPADTQTEMLLLQALAVEVADAVFAVNRLPSAIIEILLGLYGLSPRDGTPPSVDVTFTAVDTAGYAVAAGTEVALVIPGTSVVITFATDEWAVIPGGDLEVTVAATATTGTSLANGTTSGQALELVTPVEGIDSAVTASAVAGGTDTESLASYLDRGVARLSLLSQALVTPDHFTSAAATEAYVSRATVSDAYDPDTGPDPGDNPGHVTLYVYGVGGPLTVGQLGDLYDTLYPYVQANLALHVEPAVVAERQVAVTVVPVDGAVTADVRLAVESAVAAYLDPETWPWRGTLYVNELIALVDGVTGVDRVVVVTTPAVDDVISSTDNVLLDLSDCATTVVVGDNVDIGALPIHVGPPTITGTASTP